jgi:hypothetical protein
VLRSHGIAERRFLIPCLGGVQNESAFELHFEMEQPSQRKSSSSCENVETL